MDEKSNYTNFSSFFHLVFLAAFGHFVIDFMLSIWPVYKTMAHLDLAIAALLAAFAIVIGECSQLFFGKLIDKGYQKTLLIIAPLLASAAAFFPYFHQGYIFLFLLILTACIGSAAFHPTAASVLSALDTPKKALLLGFFQTAGNFGMGVGQFFFSRTHEFLNGHTSVLILPAIVLALIVMRTKFPTIQRTSGEKISLKIIGTFFKSRPLRCLYFIQVANQTILWTLVFLLPDFLAARGLDSWVVFGGGHFALLMGAALLCIPLSHLGDKMSRAKMLLGCFLATIWFYYFLLFTPELPLLLLLPTLFLLGGFIGAMTPVSLAYGSELAKENRGMVAAFLMGLVWIVSEGCGIGLSGIVADLFQENGPAKALMLLGVFLVIGTFFAFRLVQFEKAEAVVSE